MTLSCALFDHGDTTLGGQAHSHLPDIEEHGVCMEISFHVRSKRQQRLTKQGSRGRAAKTKAPSQIVSRAEGHHPDPNPRQIGPDFQ
mmetsp:Transcript_8094/g.17695  ORF Transcript_8094/g.17695 Transcript_8094/m.17695 type:complete len:87 (-) Transcript_8094:648-908(-)